MSLQNYKRLWAIVAELVTTEEQTENEGLTKPPGGPRGAWTACLSPPAIPEEKGRLEKPPLKGTGFDWDVPPQCPTFIEKKSSKMIMGEIHDSHHQRPHAEFLW